MPVEEGSCAPSGSAERWRCGDPRTSRGTSLAGGCAVDARVGVNRRHILQEQVRFWCITILVTRHGRRGR
jgi:hypothetical protein